MTVSLAQWLQFGVVFVKKRGKQTEVCVIPCPEVWKGFWCLVLAGMGFDVESSMNLRLRLDGLIVATRRTDGPTDRRTGKLLLI